MNLNAIKRRLEISDKSRPTEAEVAEYHGLTQSNLWDEAKWLVATLDKADLDLENANSKIAELEARLSEKPSDLQIKMNESILTAKEIVIDDLQDLISRQAKALSYARNWVTEACVHGEVCGLSQFDQEINEILNPSSGNSEDNSMAERK